ncbi:hypothetical protein DEU56DRAFT_756131 [Suillus clintonianus]|uniref:uncharacterized protein n=1 Tax=Suillus clintonianus TaxID=1904413 RepID=UPI001B86846F|nr:uncharacterized protein DEU56DRAFT_756131 [Suillus clintonianus]KAG2136996.1 hypothetical protein DEU56DRAFT_756131 [Suillus clintonianus]
MYIPNYYLDTMEDLLWCSGEAAVRWGGCGNNYNYVVYHIGMMFWVLWGNSHSQIALLVIAIKSVYGKTGSSHFTRWLSDLMLEKEWEGEFNLFRLFDRGELSPVDCALEELVQELYAVPEMRFEETKDQFKLVELNGQQVAEGTYPSIQHNTAIMRDFKRMIPKPVVIVVQINGRPTRALVDTGSLADFISSTLADQLRVKHMALEKPLTIQLAVQGSRSHVNFGTRVQLEYQKTHMRRTWTRHVNNCSSGLSPCALKPVKRAYLRYM